MKRWWRMLLLLVMISCIHLCAAQAAEVAEDLTKQVQLNGRNWNDRYPDSCRDGSYATFYTGRTLTITAPEGRKIGSLQLKWRTFIPPSVKIEVRENGRWRELLCAGPDYAAQYITLPEPCGEIRLVSAKGDLELSDIIVLGPGEAPGYVQRWREAPEKVELMLLSTHPDDEVLWFGGLLPYYAGQLDRDVLVVNAVWGWYGRRLELLDALWTCGVEIYPIMLGYADYGLMPDELYQVWRETDINPNNTMVSLIRQYRPDVVVLHDVDGEYGHPAHMLFSRIGRQGVVRAADEAEHVASVKQWGVWDVPKTYIHLWPERQLRMDWQIPLPAFDGKTALAVAQRAMECHKSQLSRGWKVWEGGEYDNALFGLWRTTVGDDTLKNDLFENIP